MPRGHKWEATYHPHWDGPIEKLRFNSPACLTGATQKRLVSGSERPATVKWPVNYGRPRLFHKCDFVLEVTDSQIGLCTFEDCKFAGSHWRDVKFSNCHFERCDFSNAHFLRCNFINCTFEYISASAEYISMDETAIDATAFIRSLCTNLRHFPSDQKPYQIHRFFSTRAKIARAVYIATRNEPNLDYYFNAFEQLTICTLQQKVERHRYRGEKRRSLPLFAALSFLDRLELYLIQISGILTNWGRSITRAIIFFTCSTIVYGLGYAFTESKHCPVDIFNSFCKALNLMLVVGYTAYYQTDLSVGQRVLLMENILIGVFWYSLIFPVLTRRTLR